ncbi:MAG: HisA/HisF-related TIM barrel protein [Chloroflexota bacterium]
MLVIPVLDLKGRHAVHAVRGDRVRYEPVQGVLGDGHDPLALARAYRERLGCRIVYVADLDAIAGLPPHHDLLEAMSRDGLILWVDAGVREPQAARTLTAAGATNIIVGSETLRSAQDLDNLAARFPAARLVLSVDLKDGELQAPPEIAAPRELVAQAARLKIPSIILLDLSRVGALAGPPLHLLTSLRHEYPALSYYAGGGVRGPADLDALARAGAAGALVATAFHHGTLTAADLD